jgi:aminopeptidase 2
VIWITRDNNVKGLKPIILDITEISVSSCSVLKVDRGDVEETLDYTCDYGKNNESYVINLKETKYPLTNVSVTLEFVSKLTSTLQGFYKGSFHNDDTKADSTFVSTQFSPIDCRRAFPSFDRPMFKATFKISLIRPTAMETFMSNMHVESTE